MRLQGRAGQSGDGWVIKLTPLQPYPLSQWELQQVTSQNKLVKLLKDPFHLIMSNHTTLPAWMDIYFDKSVSFRFPLDGFMEKIHLSSLLPGFFCRGKAQYILGMSETILQ